MEQVELHCCYRANMSYFGPCHTVQYCTVVVPHYRGLATTIKRGGCMRHHNNAGQLLYSVRWLQWRKRKMVDKATRNEWGLGGTRLLSREFFQKVLCVEFEGPSLATPWLPAVALQGPGRNRRRACKETTENINNKERTRTQGKDQKGQKSTEHVRKQRNM